MISALYSLGHPETTLRLISNSIRELFSVGSGSLDPFIDYYRRAAL
ncbi:Uncharacterised protein [Alistipes sp. cv1]|nr:Uncharacterised protein [Faecalibacterium prausnitzii]